MKLTEKQKRHLRALAHKKKPVVIIGGSGLTENVIREIDLSLEHHELIKVRVNAGDRQERDQMIERICNETRSALVQRIGHVAIFYRRADKPVIEFPR